MTYALFDLTGKVAVVVRGTSGIGRAIALGLADTGAKVIATGRRIEEVETTSRAIEERGRRTLRVTSDLAKGDSVGKLLEVCVEVFGKVDILDQPEFLYHDE
jgi:NAD(P)-dependent dehydrogenase (short-subunit alcohol dehydrogenase family)